MGRLASTSRVSAQSVGGMAFCASAAPVASQDQDSKPTAKLSPGVFPADLNGMRRKLPDEWAGFLKQHFNENVGLISVFFEVDRKTARAWLAGDHGVNGAPLLHLIRNNSAARKHFLGDSA